MTDTEVSPDILNTAARVRHSQVTLGVNIDQTDGAGTQGGLAVSLHWAGHQGLLLLTGTQHDTLTAVCGILSASTET